MRGTRNENWRSSIDALLFPALASHAVRANITDTLRAAIQKQARQNPDKIRVQLAEKPDALIVTGEIDLYELAKEVRDR